jgi:hypothetical protein
VNGPKKLLSKKHPNNCRLLKGNKKLFFCIINANQRVQLSTKCNIAVQINAMHFTDRQSFLKGAKTFSIMAMAYMPHA